MKAVYVNFCEAENEISNVVNYILPLTILEKLDVLFLFGNERKQVKEQAEKYLSEIEYLIVTEEIPNGL